MRRTILALLAVPLVGLSAGEKAPESGDAAKSPFPDRGQLGALGPGPALSQLQTTPTAMVQEWKLAGPLPDGAGVAPHAPGSPTEELLDEAVAGRAGLATASEAMHCAARELGRFALVHEALPDAGLVEFVAARCGSVGRASRPGFLAARVPAAVPDAEILERWRPGLGDLLRASLEGGPVDAGIWFGRDGDRAVAMVVSAPRGAHVEPFSLVAEDGAVTIRGEALAPVERAAARINRGAFGFAGCEADPAVALPRFSFRCALAPGDPEAAIDVSVQPAGRLLASGVLRTLARAPGSPADTYRRVEAATGPAPADAAAIADAVQKAVNAVRKRAALPPLTLSKTQSEEATALAPHLFASGFGLAPPAVGDLVVLGLAAGWRVGGPIKDVEMTLGYTPGSRDIGLWLDGMLRHPTGRAALLGPRVTVLAVGGASSETPPGFAAVATTYELFGKEDFAADAKRMLARLANAGRAGVAPPAALPAAAQEAVAEAARSVREEKVTPAAALDRALQESGKRLGRRLQGWVLQGSDLDLLEIPPELAALESPELALGVAFTQPDGAPWAHYAVLVIAATPDLAI